jgi:oligosaccharide amylase
MARDLPIGNGNMLIAFDNNAVLRELFFPHIGAENHTNGKQFRFGVYVNGKFRWIPNGWRISRNYLLDSLVTNVELVHDELQVKITVNDAVDFNENIYLKKMYVENLSNEEREIRLYLAQDFHIYGNDIGDTAAFRPESNSLIHYKSERWFLINIYANHKYGIDHFATGNKGVGNFEGTWKDAEDGVLEGNPITQGSVDSVIGIYLKLLPSEGETCYYWIAAGTNWEEVSALNQQVKQKSPEKLIQRTHDYWKLWLNKEQLNLDLLPDKIAWLYKRSLLITRTQINNCGSIIAANDSDVVLYNRDTYSYLWPRDGALVAYALDNAGYGSIAQNFYTFCAKIIDKEGYFQHKYTPSGSLASSWHPWISKQKLQLPIQEDETALVIWALWNHFDIFKNVEFIKDLYKPLIKRAADFMMNYRDPKTGLPGKSYDLWEERQGILTFTVAAVYGGLIAASNFAKAFGEFDLAEGYRMGAAQIRQAMDEHLFLKNENRFARMINFEKDGSKEIDSTIDASLYAIFAFGAYPADDPRVQSTMAQIEKKLWNEHGGLMRYENDSYYRYNDATPNSWFITTLWLAQYYIAKAKNKAELDQALPILNWVSEHALPSGVLAEQIHSKTGEPLSVSPLTWSHGAYITVVHEYINKLLQLEVCHECGQPRFSKKKEHLNSLG